jgi:hypothetical protein
MVISGQTPVLPLSLWDEPAGWQVQATVKGSSKRYCLRVLPGKMSRSGTRLASSRANMYLNRWGERQQPSRASGSSTYYQKAALL